MGSTIVLAIWKGGAPERHAVAVLAIAFSVQALSYTLVPPDYAGVDLIGLGVDFITLVGLGLIAIRAKRVWPLWASSFQILSIAAHFSRAVQIEIEPLVYSLMKTTPTGAVIMLLLVGTITHQMRLRKFGFDQSWMNWALLKQARSLRPRNQL